MLLLILIYISDFVQYSFLLDWRVFQFFKIIYPIFHLFNVLLYLTLIYFLIIASIYWIYPIALLITIYLIINKNDLNTSYFKMLDKLNILKKNVKLFNKTKCDKICILVCMYIYYYILYILLCICMKTWQLKKIK